MSALILVVDDDQPLLDMYEQLLTDAGYRVSLHRYSDAHLIETIVGCR